MIKHYRMVACESFWQKACHMLMVTNGIVVIILNSSFYCLSQKFRTCTSQRTKGASVMYYSKFDQEVSALKLNC